ncbi:MAG: 50S ribosomal protein L13 [Nitrososphaerota archaeon]|nr:50S ribosomal protein L13 [Nitrososphaerota archaeon]MDG6939532.1 50S ribosomal protein L13 [Nitrososphaerota archaeon]
MSAADQVVIDATGAILGRVASVSAKLALDGKSVHVVNVEQILISGGKKKTIEDWKKSLEIGSVVNPEHGPIHYRRPDNMFKRVVRGMLPWRKPSGKVAYRRLKAHHGYPAELKGLKSAEFPKTRATKPVSFYISLGDLARELGWKGVGE